MSDVSRHDARAVAMEPALSWSAIFAGAVVALATSALLTLLAAGFGYDLAAGAMAIQAAFFTAVGMLLSAFVASVAARLGGLRTEEMVATRRA